MEKIDDGGPAYPFEIQKRMVDTYGGHEYVEQDNSPGMSLRDWFAGQALIGLIQSPPSIDGQPTRKLEHLADVAYATADAMLEARLP